MGCETGACPRCEIKVGAMPTPINIGQFSGSDNIQTYHLFIRYTQASGEEIVYRGGPAQGNRYSQLVNQGLAQQYEATTTEYGDIDWPFYNLVTHRMVGIESDYDFNAWVQNGRQSRHMITIAAGSDYCGLDEDFTRETRRIGMLGRTYNAIHLDRTDNSNATVYTILNAMSLPLVKPDVHAPGWGTDLHTETTLAEDIGEPIREIRRQLNWFDNLSPLDQMLILRRAFGGSAFGG